MKTIIIFLLPVILLGIVSCDTNEPPVENAELLLKLEDASCTEAWITLTTTNLPLPTTVTIKQTNCSGDTKSQILNLSTKDSLLYIDSLLPNECYQYQASSIENRATSNELNVTTMDTTSHNFTFETFTFGGNAGSCALYDVAIINENNIWAVGEIYVADTSINGYTMFNAVHWDGNEWELKRIKTNACGGVEYPPIQTIFAFSSNDILFAHIDGSITHYNGIEFINDCSLITQLNGSANKIWGISKNNFYVVSGNGFIAHFNGQNWQRIESGTELNINDIWGDYNEKTSEWEILAVASNILQSNEKEVLKINTTATQIINKEGITGTLSSVWFKSCRKYYVAGGGGVYENNSTGNVNWQKSNYSFIRNFLFRLRGTELNDIAGAGGYGDVLHFNGDSWKSYYSDTQLNYGNYYSIAIKDNMIVSVGQDNPYAVIIIGRRN